MPDFHEILFPLPLSFGASGGPYRQVTVTSFANGFEQRNAAQKNSRRKFDAGLGIKKKEDIAAIISFFEARHGQLHGFRFCDPLDHSSSNLWNDNSAMDYHPNDQIIGIGDGVNTQFQLVKQYGDAYGNWIRPITKPVVDSVSIVVDAIAATNVIISYKTGVVEFSSPPPVGAQIHAGFLFDVPVRFDMPHLSIAIEDFGAASILHIPLIELRMPLAANAVLYDGGIFNA